MKAAAQFGEPRRAVSHTPHPGLPAAALSLGRFLGLAPFRGRRSRSGFSEAAGRGGLAARSGGNTARTFRSVKVFAPKSLPCAVPSPREAVHRERGGLVSRRAPPPNQTQWVRG
jgi:hypothetical protein